MHVLEIMYAFFFLGMLWTSLRLLVTLTFVAITIVTTIGVLSLVGVASSYDSRKNAYETISRLEKAHDACMDSPELPENTPECAERDRLVKKLESSGWCYGPIDAPHYQQEWSECGESPKAGKTQVSEVIDGATSLWNRVLSPQIQE